MAQYTMGSKWAQTTCLSIPNGLGSLLETHIFDPFLIHLVCEHGFGCGAWLHGVAFFVDKKWPLATWSQFQWDPVDTGAAMCARAVRIS